MPPTVADSSAPPPPEQQALLPHPKASTTTETTPATTTVHPRQVQVQPGQGQDAVPRRPPLPPTRRSSSMKRRLSVWDIARLTICMLGVQFTWTVELGYGTPYLLSLGISKSLTPLVWLAGPLSGLVIQPVVGVFSDALDWKIGRRRPFILIGALLTIFSMYMVAYARELAMMIVGGQEGKETDAAYQSTVKAWTIGFAVVGFYCLDFSINAVQASCRSLIMDIPPTDQQEVCNAWSGWMNNLGSVTGFFAGNLNLVKYFAPWLGDTQIKILANLAVLFFIACLAICCTSVQEIQYFPTEEDKKRSVWSTLGNIWRVFKKLPAEIQRICNVQFFAWMGWFPFLFYSTTWVAEILHRTDNHQGSGGHKHNHGRHHRNDLDYNNRTDLSSGFLAMDDSNPAAERAGSFALLCWAGVAVVCGILIPRITPQEIGRHRWPRNPFTLRNLWTMSLVWFAVCMGMTWFVDDLWAATMVIALCGVPWAVAMWVPFAMVGEIISDMKDRLETKSTSSDDSLLSGGNTNYGTISPASTLENDSTEETLGQEEEAREEEEEEEDSDDDSDDEDTSGLIGGLTESELEEERRKRGPHLDAGLVLGVHNMYIVFPQFVDAVIASCLFAMIGSVSHDQPTPTPPPPSSPHHPPAAWDMASGWVGSVMWVIEPEPVGWVLRFGGLMAIVAAYLTRRL